MNRTLTAVVAFLMTGCAAAAQPTDVVPELDAGGAVHIDAAPKPDAEAATPMVTAPDAAAPEAAIAPEPDAGGDAALPEATAPDAGAGPDADAQARAEAATVDVRTEAGEAGRGDAGGDAGRLDSGDAEAGRRTYAQLLADTFPQGCAMEGMRMCGGVAPDGDHVVETIPMSCYRGAWIVAGNFTCSMGCGTAGTLCNP